MQRFGSSVSHRFAPRLIPLALAGAIIVAACTPLISSEDAPDDIPPSSTTTTTVTAVTTTPPTDADGNLLPPQRDDPSTVAAGVLTPVDGFSEVESPEPTVNDLFITIEDWLPPDLVAGDAETVYSDADGNSIAVVSVIPELVWRGDPGFVQDLIEAITGAAPETAGAAIYTANTPGGAVLQLWSSGDGFVVASSFDDTAAITYLSGLEENRQPNDAWSTGACLFIDESEGLPYAPFPSDVVVPCSGAHNAEVLIGSTQGADNATFDEDAIDYQRNYDCDQAYNAAFGDQLTHAPGLVTYMPDADEWARGDRYLACVVIIDRNDGRQMFTGAMAERDDLLFTPDVGACQLDGLPADTVSCSAPHTYQFIGEATVDAETWPDTESTVFDDACLPLLDTLEAGPGTLEVFPLGLGPFAFENGDRTVRCIAFATVDGFLVDVLGGFDSAWRVLNTDGVAT